jgi:hypothetical protein
MPPEPVEVRAETRALIEETPEEGIRLVHTGQPLAGLLWEEWGEELIGAGMDHDRFLRIARGYADEIRLWVMGERVWEHCVAGFAGRVLRRLPDERREQERALASFGDRR